MTGAGNLPLYDPAALVQEHGSWSWLLRTGWDCWVFWVPKAAPPTWGCWICYWLCVGCSTTLLGQSSGADAIAKLLVPDCVDLFWRVTLHSAPLGLMRHRQAMTQTMRRAAGLLRATGPINFLRLSKTAGGNAPYSATTLATCPVAIR